MSLDTLDGHTTLITVNRRLSRVLRDAHDRARMAGGERVWESPDILPYTSWLQRTWHDFVAGTDAPLPALLSADQELGLWEQCVAGEIGADGGLPLLQSVEAARNAQAAWTLLHAWHLRPDGDLGYANDDVRAFRGWARRYATLCGEGDWIDLAGAADALAAGLDATHMGGTQRLLLAGLDEPTPQQHTLFSALSDIGVAVERWQPPSRDPVPVRYAFTDQEAELEAAARWARLRAEEGARGPVGIVVPGLAAARHRVAAIFEDVFTPGAPRPGAADSAPAFNISLGQSLEDVPVVGDGLLALGALDGRLSLPDAGRWLLSPYLGGGDPDWRARFDAHLRGIGEPRYQLARLEELAGSMDAQPSAEAPAPDTDGAEPFVALLEGLRDHGARCPDTQPVSAWAADFSSSLRAAGWPGARSLSSDEFQAVQAFRELLASLAALAPVLPALRRDEALAQLRRLAAAQVFQPRSGSATVQILGVLEADCIDYSHLWVTGLHDRAWPEPPRPNPFLPVALQRDLGMPRAGSEQQLRRAQAWTARMLSSAGEVVVSHPCQQGDEPLRVSALIAGVPLGAEGSLALSTVPRDRRSVQDAAPEMEVAEDDRGPAVDDFPRVRGGVSVFRDQAACPFRAFAVHRLETSDVTAPDSSLDPRVRGNLAHRLMELLWRSLGGQSRMLAMAADEREELIRTTARRVLAEEARRRPDTLRGRLLTIEQTRLESLADAWLSIDADRSAFEVETEHSESCTVAGLPVTLRPDRIDRLEDGRLLLVDYKTGQCNPRDWFGERPDEPQLPVYALAMDDTGEGRVAGLAFGVLRPGELGYRGLGEGGLGEGGQGEGEPGDGGTGPLAPGVGDVAKSRTVGASEAADWEAHKSLWRERLARIARAYLDGDARVDPKDAGATCRYCGLQPLCRIHDR
jgi:probable DNA repair protein